MKWLAGLFGLVGYTLAYLEDREGRRVARNKCPHCWFGIVCDKGKSLTKGTSPLWKTCKWGRYRHELIKGEIQ